MSPYKYNHVTGPINFIASDVFRIYERRGGATFDKLKSCNNAESQTEFLVEVRMIF